MGIKQNTENTTWTQKKSFFIVRVCCGLCWQQTTQTMQLFTHSPPTQLY